MMAWLNGSKDGGGALAASQKERRFAKPASSAVKGRGNARLRKWRSAQRSIYYVLVEPQHGLISSADVNADLNFIQEVTFGQTMKDIGTINLMVGKIGGGVLGMAAVVCCCFRVECNRIGEVRVSIFE